jgi:hypothetical protein
MKIAAAVAFLAAPALALQGGYLSQFAGGATSAPKPGGYSGVNSKPQAPARSTGSYLDGIAGSAPVAAAPVPAAPAATAPAPAAPAASSFSGLAGDGDATPASGGNYLSSLKVASTAGGAGLTGYLSMLRVQASQAAAKNPAGYLDTLRVSSASGTSGAGPASYLDNLKGAATVTARVEAASEVAMTSNEPVLAAINNLNENMNKNQKATIAILQDINSSVKKLVIRAENSVQEETELTAALQGAPAPASAAGSWTGNQWR